MKDKEYHENDNRNEKEISKYKEMPLDKMISLMKQKEMEARKNIM